MRKAIADVIRERCSCRAYLDRPIDPELQGILTDYLASVTEGHIGRAPLRFALVAATPESRAALRGLGTYGFIDGPTGFMVGAMGEGPLNLEDFGFALERAVLLATELGLGTCWLGGTFTKSSFAERIGLRPGETVPAVIATGHVAEGNLSREWIRWKAGSRNRLPASAIFFDGDFGVPLEPDRGGAGDLMELVRWAPSASNRQPWRIVRNDGGWHFYLRRTERYGPGTLTFRVLGLADLQRVDMGIAMCHWELAAREQGQRGEWVVADPGAPVAAPGTEYTATWRGGP